MQKHIYLEALRATQCLQARARTLVRLCRKEGHPHLERDDNIEQSRLITTTLLIYTGKGVRNRITQALCFNTLKLPVFNFL